MTASLGKPQPPARPPARPRSSKLAGQENLSALIFLAPFLIALVVFFVYAFGRTVYFSFTDYNLFKITRFTGLDNYADLFRDPLFFTALTNTFMFAIIVTVVQTVGALLLAVVLNQKLRGQTFFRTAYYMPSIASSAVITLIFIWLFRPTGIIAYLTSQLVNYGPILLSFIALLVVIQAIQVAWERSRGLPAGAFDPALFIVSLLVAAVVTWLLTQFSVLSVGNSPQIQLNWLSTRDKFLGFMPYPLLVIIVMNTFTTIPTLMLFFLAGLQNVSNSLYEASGIDGATPWEQMLYITVPMLRPVTFYAITTGLIGTLQMFDQVALFDGTAPQESIITLAYYVYNRVLGTGQSMVGLASAAALVLALLTIIVVQIQRRFFVSDEGVK